MHSIMKLLLKRISKEATPLTIVGGIVTTIIAIQISFSYIGNAIFSSGDSSNSKLRGGNNRWPWKTASNTVDDDSVNDHCARDVFVTLHRSQDEDDGGGHDDNTECKGLLIRDDIIVTSHECSRHNYTFNFAPLGLIRAWPHVELNSKEGMGYSKLGFLEASPPYHYRYINKPVRRLENDLFPE